MVIEWVRIVVPPTKGEQIQRALSAWAGPTGVEAGCLNCRILQESGNAQAFCYEARWKSRGDLLQHIRSEHYKRLLMLLDLSSEPPTVEFHTVMETSGLELIESARGVYDQRG